jgi:hypothetical protein
MKCLVVAFTVALAVTASVSAEVVARGVPDGLLAVSPQGVPSVAYARGQTVFVSRRVGAGRWRASRATRVRRGSTLATFASGPAGPALLVLGPNHRTLTLVHRVGRRWRATPIVRHLGPGAELGWPGLAFDRQGRPAVAYARWRPKSHLSQLVLARLTPRVEAKNVTINGWPASYVAPPAAPVVMPDGSIHVVETYGFLGTVGTIEWMPTRRSWIGQYLSGDQGDFPVGAMFAAVTGTKVYAAWTEATVAWDEYPVSLASHGREISSDFVSERGLTAGLALTSRGPQVASNQWVSSAQLGLPGDGFVWAATISGRGGTELDGWVSGFAAGPRGSDDILLSSGSSISWYRAPSLPVRVTLAAARQADGSIALTGRVRGRASGSVTLYRERPGSRTPLATVKLASGAFAAVDTAPPQPALYRAVYVDPATGVPYGRLLREPVG